MYTPSFFEMAALAVIALLIFGPERLPEIARKTGKYVAQFKREANATLNELKRSAELEEFKEVATQLRSAGNELRNTGKELKAVSAMAGPMASAARPEVGAGTTVTAEAIADAPPPFDPDAT